MLRRNQMNPQLALERLRPLIGIAISVVYLSSCGGGDRSEAAPGGEGAAASQAAEEGTVAREDFVLCPAIEGIADSLASLVGFSMDAERGVQQMVNECFIRGEDAAFVGIQLAPAIVPSVDMQASGYDAESTPAPDLGREAVFIGDQLQPHVIFRLMGHIIDVGIEQSMGSPDEATMIEAGKLIRDALSAANGG
jgi:hypothetical protein